MIVSDESGMMSTVRTVARRILRDKNMLADALGRKTPDFGKNILLRPAAVRPADQRNRAEGAAVGASFPDPDICGIGRRRQDAAVAEVGIIVLAGADPLPGQGLLNRFGKRRVSVDAQQQVDLRNLLQQGLLVPLGEASRYDQQAASPRLLILRHFQNGVDGLLLGGINKTAGIDHQNIRVLRIRGKTVPPLLQKTERRFRIHAVFIAAQRDDTDRICQNDPLLSDCKFKSVWMSG